jgi:hypothetical protein
MKSTDQTPIMTAADSVLQLGSNAYAKPATALNVCARRVMGRELFDFAFREYARRWQFKRPQPGRLLPHDGRRQRGGSRLVLARLVLLDRRLRLERRPHPRLPHRHARPQRREAAREGQARRRSGNAQRTQQRRPAHARRRIPELADFYNAYDDLEITDKDLDDYAKLLKDLDDKQRELLQSRLNFYLVDVKNVGGLVMPVVLEAHYADGTTEELRVPVSVWRKGAEKITKMFASDKELVKLVLDPHLETADVELVNNTWPAELAQTRLQLRAGGGGGRGRGGSAPATGGARNPMQEARDAEKAKAEAAKKAEEQAAKDAEKPADSNAPGGNKQ